MLQGNRMHPLVKHSAKCAFIGLTCAISACSYSPSLNLLGAYFPDWLFCAVAALILTAVVHRVSSGASWLAPAVITYPLLFSTFSLVCWLLFFGPIVRGAS
ncbi:YtcA family lipoprotein [Pseudomonas fluvialis]|uniref:YtcA family lipoprotein n=1 Tax=Pseudomonas fluvialis TaxID=1793966 RepID=UPI002893377C|nr:YtcA family lipoprotein [Pseudomonas fluvialis]